MPGGRDTPNAMVTEPGTLPEISLCASSDYPFQSPSATQSPNSVSPRFHEHSRKSSDVNRSCRRLLCSQMSGRNPRK